ncbi:MAG TPA: hypothetical protein PKE32_06705 [Miltoncostaeaceae bacterium]|nr:hypothetical protein [Miltoncostaeaceae bacterium]
MGQAGHRGEAHRGAHALERMRHPKDRRQRLAIGRIALHVQQRRVQQLQVLAALIEEKPEVLRDVHWNLPPSHEIDRPN